MTLIRHAMLYRVAKSTLTLSIKTTSYSPTSPPSSLPPTPPSAPPTPNKHPHPPPPCPPQHQYQKSHPNHRHKSSLLPSPPPRASSPSRSKTAPKIPQPSPPACAARTCSPTRTPSCRVRVGCWRGLPGRWRTESACSASTRLSGRHGGLLRRRWRARS